MTDENDAPPPESVELPIDGCLDLHTFRPRDLSTLLPDYFQACLERGITEVRVVHGKGSGALRQGVLALLPRLSVVERHWPAPDAAGGWGATMVRLRAP